MIRQVHDCRIHFFRAPSPLSFGDKNILYSGVHRYAEAKGRQQTENRNREQIFCFDARERIIKNPVRTRCCVFEAGFFRLFFEDILFLRSEFNARRVYSNFACFRMILFSRGFFN